MLFYTCPVKAGMFVFLITTWMACKQQTVKHTPYTEFFYAQHENGMPKEVGMLQDSVKQGLWVTFFPTGAINFLESYKDGRLSGPQRGFRENGTMS